MNATEPVKLTDMATIEAIGAPDGVSNYQWSLTRRNNGLWSGTGVGGNVTNVPTSTVFAMLKGTLVRFTKSGR